jgi:hypothetical protein
VARALRSAAGGAGAVVAPLRVAALHRVSVAFHHARFAAFGSGGRTCSDDSTSMVVCLSWTNCLR